MIPTIITQLIKNKNKQIKIGNINSSRDFVYVKDTVEGLIKLLYSKNVVGEVVNISSNNSFSIKEIIRILSNYTNSKPKIIIENKRLRKSELNKLHGSNKKIYNLTNWKPKYSSKENFKKKHL